MNIVFVEDEIITLEYLVNAAKAMTSETILGYHDPMKLVKELATTPVDIAFLDINLNKMSGFELAEALQAHNPKIIIIFVTSYNNYASEAFDIHAMDYLLKPVRLERLNFSLQKAILAASQLHKKNIKEVSIRLYSSVEVSINQEIIKFKRQKAAELIAYLLLHQSAHKDTLCDELFGDYDPLKALSQVHTVVHQLRKDIANASDYIQIEYVNQTYRLVLNQVSVDKIQLDQLYEQLVTSDDLGLYQKAVDMFHKGLLTQVDWPWTLELQLKAEDKHIDVLKRMIDLSIQKQEYKALKNALIHYRPYVDELDLDEYVTIIRQHFNEAFLKQWVNETS